MRRIRLFESLCVGLWKRKCIVNVQVCVLGADKTYERCASALRNKTTATYKFWKLFCATGLYIRKLYILGTQICFISKFIRYLVNIIKVVARARDLLLNVCLISRKLKHRTNTTITRKEDLKFTRATIIRTQSEHTARIRNSAAPNYIALCQQYLMK